MTGELLPPTLNMEEIAEKAMIQVFATPEDPEAKALRSTTQWRLLQKLIVPGIPQIAEKGNNRALRDTIAYAIANEASEANSSRKFADVENARLARNHYKDAEAIITAIQQELVRDPDEKKRLDAWRGL